jgi:hypothetical protein
MADLCVGLPKAEGIDKIRTWLVLHGFDAETTKVSTARTPNQRIARACHTVLYAIERMSEKHSPGTDWLPELTEFEYWLAHMDYYAFEEREFR